MIDSCNLEVHGLSPGLSDVVPCLSPPPPQCLLGAAGLVCSLPLENVTGSGRNPNGNRAALHFQGRILIGFPWTNHWKKQVWPSLALSPSLQQVCVRCTVPDICSRTPSKGVGMWLPKGDELGCPRILGPSCPGCCAEASSHFSWFFVHLT